MATAGSIHFSAPVYMPQAATTIDGFRAWAASDEFPERGHISYINGQLVIDISPEALESHNLLKGEISRIIGNMNAEFDLGRQYFDRALFSNSAAGISTEPDGMFVCWKTMESQKLTLTPLKGRTDDFIELVGSPDWVLEIVSPGSIKKDTQLLLDAYHRAGVREYWLVDALGKEINFQLLVNQPDGFQPVVPQNGWYHSPVFSRQFQLVRQRDRLDLWKYTLRVQEL